MAKKDPNIYPKGWNRKKVDEIIAHYDNLSEEDWAKEIEAAPLVEAVTWVKVPNELLPKVRKVLASERRSA